MRCVTISKGTVVVAERADPVPGKGELLVKVRAAGLNAADLVQAAGLYPAPPGSPADIPGLELAGEVVATGPGVLGNSPGDRVMAVVGGGGQAELVLVNERTAMPVPEGMDWPSAGGFPEAFTTAHDALFTQCRLSLGDRLLVHGAAGGVGTAAVQLGVACGAAVTATVRAPQNRDGVSRLGARVTAPEGFETSGPFDVILELVGATNMMGNLSALATGGRISVIGVGAGSTVELDLGILMARRCRIHGSTLRTRSLEAKAEAARRVEAQVLPVISSGRAVVPIASCYGLSEVTEAYDRFAAGGKLGKIVISMDDGT